MTDVGAADRSERAPSSRSVAIEFAIPSDVRFIENIVERVAKTCEEMAFAPHQVSLNVPVALTEALSNAILRGNGGDIEKVVRVRARVDDTSLVLEVADEGTGFDLDTCTIDPTRAENLEREDGRGLYLMRRLMDRVERFTDNGNVVRLVLLKP